MRWLVWMGRRLRASDGAWSRAACRSSPLGVGAARARVTQCRVCSGRTRSTLPLLPATRVTPGGLGHGSRGGTWTSSVLSGAFFLAGDFLCPLRLDAPLFPFMASAI